MASGAEHAPAACPPHRRPGDVERPHGRSDPPRSTSGRAQHGMHAEGSARRSGLQALLELVELVLEL
eukprot:CAMPEP_0176223704 /NCGR_PEP_ID=MMETSP0121_2-20121125/20880_1 /TAXON_ID=160619 /ORGANISM="Kryptoperidinium foliaceum, Strain CCMP 1326" /LENGTH=66 /DNA_ID=CAMNT_0017562943 /DNA_START=74 /DNA_END=271 /DNA_ORIENTATION=-